MSQLLNLLCEYQGLKKYPEIVLRLLMLLEQGVDMFGNRVGFLKFKADVIDKETGSKVCRLYPIRLCWTQRTR